ncbi:MAG: hypothetical protein E7256_12690 [Lachnospiraceae bacterium]|nr:hypothetical protein [Lachnospiraceae bacterium]
MKNRAFGIRKYERKKYEKRKYGKRTSWREKRRRKRLIAVTAMAAGIAIAVPMAFGTVQKISVSAGKQGGQETEASRALSVREEDELFKKMAEKISWEQYRKDLAAYLESHKVTFHTVEESYFDNTLFIGDSRTLGLSQFARLGKADYFSDAGMTVFSLFKAKVSDRNFSLTDLRTLLSSHRYERIYLMLGINEIGYPMEGIKKQYKKVLEEIQSLQPDAEIILEANMNVARKKEKANKNFAVENINTLNQIIASFADQKHIYYIDINESDEFVDEQGYLKDEVSTDGVHPNVSYYQSWAQWLCENAI